MLHGEYCCMSDVTGKIHVSKQGGWRTAQIHPCAVARAMVNGVREMAKNLQSFGEDE
jgi:hypothetical protein